MARILGPGTPFPAENGVVIQCLVEPGTPTFVNHPAFTNDEEANNLCDSVRAVRIFCSASDLRPASRFVGVVASMPTIHGAHGHVSVWVRGCVTMACDLEALGETRSMDTLGFVPSDPSGIDAVAINQFVGLPVNFIRPLICKPGPPASKYVIGTLVERGRLPSNEVRIILRAGDIHGEDALDIMQRPGLDPDTYAKKLTLADLWVLADSDSARWKLLKERVRDLIADAATIIDNSGTDAVSAMIRSLRPSS